MLSGTFLPQNAATIGRQFLLKQSPQLVYISLYIIMGQNKSPLGCDEQVCRVFITVDVVYLFPLIVCLFLAVIDVNAVSLRA